LPSIDTLLAQMTLAEKLGQLTMTAAGYAVTGPVVAGDTTQAIREGSVGNLLNLFGAEAVHAAQRLAVEESRLKIPLLLGLDVIHGYRTIFPVPLAETGIFDPQVWALTAREAAREASAEGVALTFAPMLDVARDPRWGRIVEGPGEDPYVGRCLAQAKVRGWQTARLESADALAACAKHFCAYGAVTAGREYAPVDISARTLHEVYLQPFAAAVAAGVAAVMPAFTDMDGTPMTAHVALLRDHLRGRLGFRGVIISDYHAIAELMNHGVASDLTEAAALALRAGVDVDMMSDAYRTALPEALDHGLVTMAQIDAAVRRVLELKERLGLFADPYRRGSTPERAAALSGRRALARTVAARSLVLLSNVRQTLPLAPSVRTLALLGPLADAPAQMHGPWSAAGDPSKAVSVLAGLRERLPQAHIAHAAGVALRTQPGTDALAAQQAALQLCDAADVIILCLGESATQSGEAASRAHPELPEPQRPFAEAVVARARALGKPVVVVLFSGRPLVVPWLIEQAQAVLAAWFPGSEAGHAIAEILSGERSPSGRTPVSWPRAVGQIPVFFGERPSGRPYNPRDFYTTKYLDESNDPLFAFGHGLGYGECARGNLQLTPAQLTQADTLEVRVEVHNPGERTLEETLFVFTHLPVASVTQPRLTLQGFGKITLGAGERGTLTLHVPATQLRFLGPDLEPLWRPGTLQVFVGPSAERSRLLCGSIELRAS